MRRNRILEIPATTVIAAFGVIALLILLILSIVGLLGGALKEVFYYITSSQGFSTKTTSFDSSPANVLVTQE
jgi:hypothetical protein